MIVLVCLESPRPSQASRAALNLACSLGENAQVIVLSAGGGAENASCELARQSMAVRRIVQLRDTALDGADFLTLGMVLAEAAKHLEARVILVGEHSDEEGQGLVPAALAHHLCAPLLARVHGVELSATNEEVLQVTVRASGCLCKVSSALPIVLATSSTTASASPQPALGGMSTSPTVETLSLSQLGLDHSRLVPRPDLLGARVPAKTDIVEYKSFDEAAQLLLRS
jgi:electron transfer flavoprotein alpha/beta subunit